MKLITLLLPDKIIKSLDEMVRDNLFASRSHAIRFMVQDFLFHQGYLKVEVEAHEPKLYGKDFEFFIRLGAKAGDRDEAVDIVSNLVAELRRRGYKCKKWRVLS